MRVSLSQTYGILFYSMRAKKSSPVFKLNFGPVNISVLKMLVVLDSPNLRDINVRREEEEEKRRRRDEKSTTNVK